MELVIIGEEKLLYIPPPEASNELSVELLTIVQLVIVAFEPWKYIPPPRLPDLLLAIMLFSIIG